MKTKFNNRAEYIDYLTDQLGDGYDIQRIADETSGWDMSSIRTIDGKRRATSYIVTASDAEMAATIARYSEEISEYNFFLSTTADFESCAKPSGVPDYVSGSGSAYWYDEHGVTRESDHWGRGVASCDWLLDGTSYGYGMHDDDSKWLQTEAVCGRCAWSEFDRK